MSGRDPVTPLRLLVVSNLLPPRVEGGAELAAWREMQALAARGHEVLGLTIDWADAQHVPAAEDGRALTVTRVPAATRRSRRPGNELVRNREVWRALAGHLTTLRPHLVHFHNLSGIDASIPARVARHGTPTVATFHDGWGVCPKSILLLPDGRTCAGAESRACVACLEGGRSKRFTWTRRARVALRNPRVLRALAPVDRLVFPSRHHLELYVRAGYPRDRCRLLPHPIPQGAALPPKPAGDGALRLLYLGWIPAHKGIDVLLDALTLLPPDLARLVVHGRLDARDRRRFRRALARRGLTDRVEHRGALAPASVRGAIAESDAVVVPSRCVENSPLTVLEALSSGRPVIASAVGGIPELVRDGENGFTFPAGDAAALAERIRALGDRGAREAMGERACASIRDRDPAAHVEALEAIYAELFS